jgi:hypothetical protein
MSSEEEIVNGMAWVEDGQIKVKNPGPKGNPPCLCPARA